MDEKNLPEAAETPICDDVDSKIVQELQSKDIGIRLRWIPRLSGRASLSFLTDRDSRKNEKRNKRNWRKSIRKTRWNPISLSFFCFLLPLSDLYPTAQNRNKIRKFLSVLSLSPFLSHSLRLSLFLSSFLAWNQRRQTNKPYILDLFFSLLSFPFTFLSSGKQIGKNPKNLHLYSSALPLSKQKTRNPPMSILEKLP